MPDFEHLKAFCGPKELQELSNTFAGESETLLSDLSNCIKNKDMETGKKLAHQLKGLAATLAASDMQSQAATIEGQIKSASWQQAEELYGQLAQTVVRVGNDLKNAAFPDKL